MSRHAAATCTQKLADIVIALYDMGEEGKETSLQVSCRHQEILMQDSRISFSCRTVECMMLSGLTAAAEHIWNPPSTQSIAVYFACMHLNVFICT